MKLTLDHIETVAPNIKTFWFSTPNKPRYIAGQFVEIHLPQKHIDSRGDKRWFTLSSSPTEDMLAITTKFTNGQESSFKDALKSLKPGSQLSASSPMGDFVLPKDSSIPLVFIAGGIGCTPFRSITKYLLDKGEQRDITIIYSAHTPEEIAFKDIFNTNSFTFIPYTDGQLSGKKILSLIEPADQTRYFYISGPEGMVEDLRDQLKACSVNERHIFGDYFPGY